jgi:hypothetical protein
MTRPRGRATPTWVAVLAGAALGLGVAFGGSLAWSAIAHRAASATGAGGEVAAQVDLFRLPASPHREMFLVPAGPDANGEPALAKALFPGEDPPRELASLLLANVSPDEPWTVDLDAQPLACRRSGAEWETLRGLAASGASHLAEGDRLRLRGLGAAGGRVVVEPKSMRRVLVALPRNCRISDLSDVQWGTTPLYRDQLDLERIRRFREDPSAVTTGR